VPDGVVQYIAKHRLYPTADADAPAARSRPDHLTGSDR
jgi:hypothetical protein